MSALRRLLAPASAALLLLAACHDEKIASYRVPKETDPQMPLGAAAMPPAADASANMGGTANNSMAATAVPTAQDDVLTWTAPANWKAKATAPMRKGSYAIAGDDGTEGDVAITAFPEAGGLLPNLNRWRGQIQLPPITEAELPSATSQADINGLHVTLADIANPNAPKPQRILVAIVQVPGATWFFKLLGSDALVTKEKPAFDAFVKTIKAR